METAITDLEISCLLRVFSLLGAKDCARIGCVHPLWNTVVNDEAIWKAHLDRDFATASAINADGSPATSYRAAYMDMQTSYADVAGPMLTRAITCWNAIKAWLAVHSPQILATLNPGATAAEVAHAEQELGHKLPLAVTCIYRVHNGQNLQLQQRSPNGGHPDNLLMGLFGTLMFYDCITSNALLSLTDAVAITHLFRSVRPMGARHPLIPSNHMVFAHSFQPNDKVCILDISTGAVYLKLPPQLRISEDWPLAPGTDSFIGAHDGMLRWMEEYAHRLSAGWYGNVDGEALAQSLADAGIKTAGAISLFPRVYPAAATAITRGVQVTWSSVLVPQESRQRNLMFTYSVRFALLKPEQEAAALQRLQVEQQAWHQQQQQVFSDPAKAAAATAAAEPMDTSESADVHVASTTAAAAAAAGTGGSSSSLVNASPAGAPGYQQAIPIGSCDASAGKTCVPQALQATPSWEAAAAAAATAGAGGSNGVAYGGPPPAAAAAATAAPAGAAEALAAAGDLSGTTASLSSCQLETRNWHILDAEGTVADSVSGEGVVGLYPLLIPGGDSFAYASCTPLAALRGRHLSEVTTSRAQTAAAALDPRQLVGRVLGGMEGRFTFVAGSMMQPVGREFNVQCPRMVFAVPEYLY